MTEGATTQHSSIAAALVAFQRDMPTVGKTQTATIPGKDGRSGYSYKYADLADVAAAAHPLLAEHGIAFTCTPLHVEGVGFVLRGKLLHESGGEIVGELPIVGRDAQSIGSSLTYHRRYLLGCLTGIVTDEDDDGSRAAAARNERPQSDAPPAMPSAAEIERTARRMLDDATAAIGDKDKLLPIYQYASANPWLAGWTIPPSDDGPGEHDGKTLVEFIMWAGQQQPAAAESSTTTRVGLCDARQAADADADGVVTRWQQCTRELGHEGEHQWW